MLTDVSQNWLDILPKGLQEIENKINQITEESKLCPPKHLWFEWARLTELNSIKVIIIGQDPYYDKGTAHGLAFSSKGIKIPPSLQTIYKCLKNQGEIKKIPKSSDLTEWARRGVLLLNAALSTEEGTPAKHSKIWSPFVKNLITAISNYGEANDKKYTFLLWGNHAKSFKNNVNAHHEILEWIHPSPMAQSRASFENKFINCNHFYICRQQHKIDWSLEDNTTDNMNDDVKEPTQIEIDPRVIQVFTDGSCRDNGKEESIAGFAAIFVGGILKGKRLRGKLVKNASNIRAEGKAIICVLERLQKIEKESWDRAEIFTDSEFWVNMLTKYMLNWDEAKFNKQKNPDITKKIWSLWNLFPNHELKITWVPAHNKLNWEHSTNEYEKWCYHNNHAVDELANFACSE